MKKFISAVIAFIIVFSFTSCGNDTRKYKIYYKNADGDSLVVEEHKTDALTDSDDKEVITYLIEEMAKSPQTEGYINALPGGIKLLGASIRGKTATVNLSKEYYRNKDVDELLARIAIVNTLSEIDGIENVTIKVEGQPLVSTTTGTEISTIRPCRCPGLF
ncbi:MAG: GerMN domain-containing protein [Clostridia bacterium]